MTLITCSGTIGKVNLVGKHWENWTANQHIIRVVPANDEIAGYIYIFLQSEYLELFLRNLLLDEKNLLYNRNIHISYGKQKTDR